MTQEHRLLCGELCFERLTIGFGQLSLPIVQLSAAQHNALEGGGHHPLSRPAGRSENEQVAAGPDRLRKQRQAGSEIWLPCLVSTSPYGLQP